MSTSPDVRLNRKGNLEFLIDHFGSVAKLNLAVGRKATDVTFSQIRHGAVHPKTNLVRHMGNTIARKIELALCLPNGWLDHAHVQSEVSAQLHSLGDARQSPPIIINELIIPNLSTSVIANRLELSESFVLKQLGDHCDRKALRFFVPNRNLLDGSIPGHSIVLVDTASTTFTFDGIYLIKNANGHVMVRSISTLADGSYIVQADSTKESFASIESLMLLGRIIYVFCAKSL